MISKPADVIAVCALVTVQPTSAQQSSVRTVCLYKIPRNRQVDPGSPNKNNMGLKGRSQQKPAVFF